MKIYERFSSKHDNFDVLSKFVKISEKVYCKTAEAIEALILSKLVEKFSHLEELWNLRALNKMAQFKRTLGLSSEEDKILKSKKFCTMQAMKIFESALRKFNSPTMWEYYYRFRFQCLKIDSYKDCTEEIVSLLYSIENSWSSNKITPEIFQLWIKLYYTCFKTNCLAMQRLAKILLDANQRWPNDFEIAFFVGCFLTKLPENQRMTQKFFDDCFRRIHCEIKSTNVDLAINLIELYIDWSIQKKISATKVSKIVTDLNNNIQNYPRKMSEYFKPKLLAIYYHLFGIKKTRLFYEQNKSCPPITKQFFYKMSEIEAHWIEMLEEPETTTATRSNNQNDCNRIKIYDDLIHFFGPDDVQIWLDYIQLVWDDDLSKANNLYQQALKTLNPLQCDQFIRQYSLIKSNRMK
ncbi:hypothetical protein NH340_JMT06548 [Sarcoptes scabiei]|nr:hypothetical protein NH340_JMT06548 [Sarcoptes scabiei]